jgi:hypothetical protein
MMMMITAIKAQKIIIPEVGFETSVQKWKLLFIGHCHYNRLRLMHKEY